MGELEKWRPGRFTNKLDPPKAYFSMLTVRHTLFPRSLSVWFLHGGFVYVYAYALWLTMCTSNDSVLVQYRFFPACVYSCTQLTYLDFGLCITPGYGDKLIRPIIHIALLCSLCFENMNSREFILAVKCV